MYTYILVCTVNKLINNVRQIYVHILIIQKTVLSDGVLEYQVLGNSLNLRILSDLVPVQQPNKPIQF